MRTYIRKIYKYITKIFRLIIILSKENDLNFEEKFKLTNVIFQGRVNYISLFF